MQEITDLERRITAALERIGRGIDGIVSGAAAIPVRRVAEEIEGGMPFSPDDVRAALDEERMANAQLNERVRVLRDKEAAERQRNAETLSALQNELQGERKDLGILREQIDSLEQELASLRAERRAEADQITDIVAALNPLIEEARHA